MNDEDRLLYDTEPKQPEGWRPPIIGIILIYMLVVVCGVVAVWLVSGG